MNNRFNKVFPSFDSLNIEFSPSSRLIDMLPNHFSFHSYLKSNDYNLIDDANQLNDIAITASSDCLHALIISDTGIKNNVAMSITYIYV